MYVHLTPQSIAVFHGLSNDAMTCCSKKRERSLQFFVDHFFCPWSIYQLGYLKNWFLNFQWLRFLWRHPWRLWRKSPLRNGRDWSHLRSKPPQSPSLRLLSSVLLVWPLTKSLVSSLFLVLNKKIRQLNVICARNNSPNRVIWIIISKCNMLNIEIRLQQKQKLM